MTEFNEYERKNTGLRVKITYERTSGRRMNPWEISNFISRITTHMYGQAVLCGCRGEAGHEEGRKAFGAGSRNCQPVLYKILSGGYGLGAPDCGNL